MKHGSFPNIANVKSPLVPKVGMGATVVYWTDRSAYTISKIVNEKKFLMRKDIATRTDNNGMSDAQSYSYVENPKAQEIEVKLKKNGIWITETGDKVWVGTRMEYYDYSF